MKLITNRIHLSAPKTSLDDLLKRASAANQVKTASTNTVKKTVKAEFKKEDIEDADDKDEEKTEEGKKAKDCKPCEAKSKKSVKTAEEKGVETTDTGELEAKNFTNDADKEPEDDETKSDKKTSPNKDGECVTSGQPQWEGKQENNNNPKVVASYKDRVKTGIPSGKWISVNANLKPEVKNKVKAYWRNLYGEDYANAMVADK